MTMYTARFQNPKLASGEFQPVPICLSLPRWKLRYELGPCLRELAPKWRYMRSSREVYTDCYLRDLELLKEVSWDERPLVLLCYEDLRDPEQWCHRRIFAEWWLAQIGEVVDELEEDDQVRLF